MNLNPQMIPVRAKGQTIMPFMFKKEVSLLLRVCDGDTFYCTVMGWPPLFGRSIGIRIRGIDAAEVKSTDPVIFKKAMAAKEETTKVLFAAKKIMLKNISRGKYFRLIADVEFDGVDLGQHLLEKKLVEVYK